MVKLLNKLTVGELKMFSGRVTSFSGQIFELSDEQASSDEAKQALERGWVELVEDATDSPVVSTETEAETEVETEAEIETETEAEVETETESKKTRQRKAK